MVKSIRWRLQIWYTLVLIVVVTGFAAIMFMRARTTAYREIDERLNASAHFLDASLRSFPAHVLDGNPPPDISRRKGKFDDPSNLTSEPGDEEFTERPQPKKKDGLAFPARKDGKALVNELAVQPQADVASARANPYFAIWRFDGSLLKAMDLPENVDPRRAAESTAPEFRFRGQYREATMLGPRRTLVLVGISTAHEEEDLRLFAWQLGGAGLIALAIGLAGGWLISARIFRPIAAMAATASEISAANMSGRIDAEHVETELAGLAQVLNATFDRLQDAFERQVQFTADASHELRTPLAIIRSHAQLALERSRSAEEYRQTIDSCLRAANRMASIIEGLLALARADAGQEEVQKLPVELGGLLTDAVTLIRPLAEGKKVTLTSDMGRAWVMADQTALTQVVNNLLNNAIQYNRPGGTIRVRLISMDSVAIFTVTDTGSGIPEQDRPHIFERFYRVDKARSRAAGGSGLGLAICKNIVEAHGGTIGFESKVESGTTFWVRLPVNEG